MVNIGVIPCGYPSNVKLNKTQQSLRNGYTTSACAAAAAAAAVIALATQNTLDSVTIDLPNQKGVTFEVYCCEWTAEQTLCTVIKDSGDDAERDVTHGIEIQAAALWLVEPEILILGGKGVGVVTQPGLLIPVGEAAINPAPRRIITDAVRKTMQMYGIEGVCITIQVPQGEEIAPKTMNPALGIVGGISILGTDGIQRPYSSPSYRASIYYALKLPAMNGIKYFGITSGRRSLAALHTLLPDREDINMIEVGDEIGYTLKQAARFGYAYGYVGVMPGKLSKLAQGRMQTHVDYGKVDFDFLADVAQELGLEQTLIEKIRQARTVHQVLSWMGKESQQRLLYELTKRAADFCTGAARNAFAITIAVFSIHGDHLLSYSPLEMEYA